MSKWALVNGRLLFAHSRPKAAVLLPTMNRRFGHHVWITMLTHPRRASAARPDASACCRWMA